MDEEAIARAGLQRQRQREREREIVCVKLLFERSRMETYKSDEHHAVLFIASSDSRR
jgi:hypothetical protein